jgi:hypothetical protein
MPSKYTLPEDHPYVNGRQCTRCQEFKLASEYNVEGDSRAYKGVAMRSICKPCDAFREWKSLLPKRYGITYEQYTEMLESQAEQCAICGSKCANNARTSGKLFVDHCHTSGAVRGLLCSKCNHGLGLFNDDIDRLRSAINYLERNSHV